MTVELQTALTADWLNAWLAAIGCTVLVPGVQLAWSEEAQPGATLSGPFAEPTDLIDAIASAVSGIAFEETVIAAATARDPYRGEYCRLVSDAREQGDPTVAHMTDLDGDFWKEQPDKRRVSAGAFHVAAPGTTNTFGKRFRTLAGKKLDLASEVSDALLGNSTRIEWNGLGFDYTRISNPAHTVRTDAVSVGVELLAFVGTILFPHRGDGAERARTRGWKGGLSRAGSFTWPTWSQPLDAAAIDALLDTFYAEIGYVQSPAVYEVVPFRYQGSTDQTRGYASRRRT